MKKLAQTRNATQEENLQRAIRLAQTGFKVFPSYPMLNGKCTCNTECHSAGKHPRLRGYLDHATDDEEVVRSWWTKWPDAGIGICPDNQLVLDIDGPHGHENLLKFQADFGKLLPATFTCVSGSIEPYHYHLYYRLPPNTRLLNKPLCKFRGLDSYSRIDVRSNRGQVAAPGTMHRDGQRYKWDMNQKYDSLGCPNNISELPQAPEWLLLALGGLHEAKDTRQPTRINVKRNGGPFCGKGAEDLIPETDQWYLRVILDRWPILRSGKRNCLQGKPITYLIANGLSTDRVFRIMQNWLHYQSECFDTPIAQAILDLQDSINRTARRLNEGKIELIRDHVSLTSSQTLQPVLKEFLQTVLSSFDFLSTAAQKHSNDLSVSIGPNGSSRATISGVQRVGQFLESLLLHYQYRVNQGDGNRAITMTHAQLQGIIKNRFNESIDRKQLYRLADLFITRPDRDEQIKPANKVELLRQIKRGHIGTPSVYEVTGIPNVLEGSSKDSPEGLQ